MSLGALVAAEQLEDGTNAYSQFLMGNAYHQGLNGIARDDHKAVEWWSKAAEHGEVHAQVILAGGYARGIYGLLKNYVESVKWSRKAAEQGNADGEAMLGIAYGTGDGVPQDSVRAYMWLSLAAAQGDKTAAEIRDGSVRFMTPDQISEAQRLAREWKPK